MISYFILFVFMNYLKNKFCMFFIIKLVKTCYFSEIIFYSRLFFKTFFFSRK